MKQKANLIDVLHGIILVAYHGAATTVGFLLNNLQSFMSKDFGQTEVTQDPEKRHVPCALCEGSCPSTMIHNAQTRTTPTVSCETVDVGSTVPIVR